MEDYYNVKRLALILAKQAEIEGMKIENLIRVQQNQTRAYNGEDFKCASNDLENLAYEHNEQL